MQDFSEKNFSAADFLSARRLIFVTAIFGGIFSIISFMTQIESIRTNLPGLEDPAFVLFGAIYAVIGTLIYRELVLTLLQQSGSPSRALIAAMVKLLLIALMLLILKSSSRAEALSLLVGVFSFVPAVLWVGIIPNPHEDAERGG